MEIGQKIAWERYGQWFSGTVVKIHRYPWCPGAHRIVAVDDTPKAHLHEFSSGMGYTMVDATEPVGEARARYINNLRTFPNWVAQLEAGINPTEDWGVWVGFSQFVPAR